MKFQWFFSLLLVLQLLILPSCHKTDEPVEEITNDRVILLYAVAANNLYSDLKDDIKEILRAAPRMDLKRNALLIYSVDETNQCKLERLTQNSKGEYEFSLVKSYPETPLSVEEERINEVITYVNDNYDYQRKGLILWSHATGWIPFFMGSKPTGVKQHSFGNDKYNGTVYECNITTLADAIPDGIFDFIWFDCCYMANIETIYQLRGKADYLVGYVTEIWGEGMPYNLTMPYLLRYNADLEKAALELFNYYDVASRPVTVSITQTSQLENLAAASALIFDKGIAPTDFNGIHNYSRLSGHPFYDMGELMNAYQNIDNETLREFNIAINKAVIFKLASPFDFSWPRPEDINQATYSGLSMHNFINSGSSDEEFYKTLDWYKATRLQTSPVSTIDQ